MLTLAVDTCLDACTAVVGEDGRVLAAISEPMSRGHQERLAPMVAELMKTAGLTFDRLERIGATVGPGSFTGLRIGLSFAKAMALARGVPCAGFSSLEALAFGHVGAVIAIADARRGQAYWQAFYDGAPLAPPTASAIEDVAGLIAGRPGPWIAAGPGAGLLEGWTDATLLTAAGPSAEALLALASRPGLGSTQPLYLRAADAKLPGGLTP